MESLFSISSNFSFRLPTRTKLEPFLANSIDDTPWVHIDIAGTAWTQDATKKKPYNPKGATGFGVRMILDYLKSQ